MRVFSTQSSRANYTLEILIIFNEIGSISLRLSLGQMNNEKALLSSYLALYIPFDDPINYPSIVIVHDGTGGPLYSLSVDI